MHRLADHPAGHPEDAAERRRVIVGRFRRLASGCLVAFVIVPAIAFLAAWLGMRAGQREAAESLDWPSVPGRILESEVVEHRGRRATDERPTRTPGTAFRARVRYSYVADGAERTGARIEVFQRYHATSADAEVQLAPYPVGSEVAVRVDPADPARAVLEPGPATFDNTYFFAFGGGFLAIAAVLATLLASLLRARHRDHTSPAP